MEYMRTALPTNFRITGFRQQAIDIREQIMSEFVPYIKDTKIEGLEGDIEPPHPLEWYPNDFGWQFVIPRAALRKSKELSKFNSFLVTETEVGNISRQEAVSMVPPLFLDVQPNHYVLDMCAAPGSKTAQLVEALHVGCEPGQIPSGVVIANDADYKRACMLVHQMNRLSSPSLIVTNHSGERFPNILQREAASGSKRTPIQFDRILCDVPCSGDGTTRKNVRVWEKWKADDAHSLHPVQSKILSRAAYLLKTGGRLVYSTCSLNPIENEAVVAHILDHFEGALQLVDVSDQLPALKRSPGLKTWKMMSRDGELHGSYDTVPAEECGRNRRKYVQDFFPLTPERMDELHIERCMRIYPHMQNTGGFFVAVLEKVAPIAVDEQKKAADRAASVAAAMDVKRGSNGSEEKKNGDEGGLAAKRAKLDDDKATSKASSAGEQGCDSGEDLKQEEGGNKVPWKAYLPDNPREDPALAESPFVFFDPNQGELKSILDYYDIKDTMPRNGFLSRIESGDSFRSVYFASDSVRQILELAGSRLRVVNTGIRVFSRNGVRNAGCSFRLVSEGVPQLLPHLPEKFVACVSFSDLKILLDEVNPLLAAFSQEFQERLDKVPVSSSVAVVYDPSKHSDDEEQPFTRMTALLTIPCWRGHASLSIHMVKSHLISLIHRILGRVADRNTVGAYKLDNNKTASATPTPAEPAGAGNE